MRSFNRDSRSGGRRQGGGFRGSDSRPREMHKAVCDNCGNDCEVPFRPRGDKPIYCSNCFEEKGGGSSKRRDRNSSGEGGFQKRDNTNKQLLEQVSSLNAKLDRILNVLESGAQKKPASKKVKVKKTIKKATPKDEKLETKKTSKKVVKKATPKT